MSDTFYWHDYETFGISPCRDRPAQFAGVRTDEELNEIGDPLVIYCKPPRDRLPHPEACLLTGITPQLADEKGLIEADFIAKIHAELATPQTCGAGYNSLRFDDEVTRYTLYRNFYDPYAREWQNSNSRWDIIDLMRMCYALRPQGIEWPRHEDGLPSFRLQDLSGANGIGHESAHDALSDVRATIGLARLVRDRQRRLYDWLFELRDKRKVAASLDLNDHKSIVHTSRMYSSEYGCTTLVMPVCEEKRNRNSVLVYDLRINPEPFLELDVDILSQRLFTQANKLSADEIRLPVKSIKYNKCPALAPLGTINQQAAERMSLDLSACEAHRKILINEAGFLTRISQAYSSRVFDSANDVDCALYDGFICDADRLLCNQVRKESAEKLRYSHFEFQDERLPELLFRYRARNWPATLNASEANQWQVLCTQWLNDAGVSNGLSMNEYKITLERLNAENSDDEKALKILDELKVWGDNLLV